MVGFSWTKCRYTSVTEFFREMFLSKNLDCDVYKKLARLTMHSEMYSSEKKWICIVSCND